MHHVARMAVPACGLALFLALSGAALAQTAGEGSGSEVVGTGAMEKSPEHAEKGGDRDRDPHKPDQPGQRSDAAVSSGSISPATAPR